MMRRVGSWKTALAVRVLVVALCLCVGSCRKTGGTPTRSGAFHIVRIPRNTLVTNIEDIADELGFFEEKGVRVDWQGELATGQSMHAALASGQFDVVSGSHSDSVVKVRLAGGKVRVIGGADATERYPHMSWYVLEDSPIRGPQDLIGKKIAGQAGRGETLAIDGCSGMGLGEYLRHAGIDILKANVEGVSLPSVQMAQALKMRLIDVGTFHPPFKGRMDKTPGYRKLFDDYIAMSPSTGKGATRVTTAREAWLKEDPEGVRGFVAGMALAANWANTHEALAKKIWAKRLGIKAEDEQYLDMYWWLENQVVREHEDVQIWIDLMVRYGQLRPGQVKADEVYTNEFNPYCEKLRTGALRTSDVLREAESIALRHWPPYLGPPPP